MSGFDRDIGMTDGMRAARGSCRPFAPEVPPATRVMSDNVTFTGSSYRDLRIKPGLKVRRQGGNYILIGQRAVWISRATIAGSGAVLCVPVQRSFFGRDLHRRVAAGSACTHRGFGIRNDILRAA